MRTGKGKEVERETGRIGKDTERIGTGKKVERETGRIGKEIRESRKDRERGREGCRKDRERGREV